MKRLLIPFVFFAWFVFTVIVQAQTDAKKTETNETPAAKEMAQVAAPEETPAVPATACTVEIEMTGTIGLSSLDMLKKGLDRVKEKNCQSLLVNINTPGGSLQTTRMIVEEILNSPVPVLCFITPSGAHAGSAGAIIMQACHVNGAMRATNLGAATPITGDGKDMPEDLRKKMLNDTTSWLDGITELRGRNKQFGREIITEAKAVSATEAEKLGAIDFVADRKLDFLQFAENRTVKMSENKEQKVVVGDLETITPNFRDKFLAMITDPQIAYLLFMASLGLIYFEITHPGTMVAGVVGGIALVISMVALHKMDVQYGGLLLLLIGVALMIAESLVASFGILGIGGIAAFIAGSLFLFDPQTPGGYSLPLDIIIITSVVMGGLMLAVAYMAFNTRNVRRKGSYDDLLGENGVIVTVKDNKRSGQMEIAGETWKFRATEDVDVEQTVYVNGFKGLTLIVGSKKED